jgi:uncharacterized protein (DUF736 family)
MAKIGTFTKNKGVYTGSIKTLVLNAKIEIVPVEQTGEKAPNYKVYSEGSELGAAWDKTSEQGTQYISLKLDDPAFSAAIYVSLFKAEGHDEYSLLWQRPNNR